MSEEKKIRAFLAIYPAEAVQKQISSLQSKLKRKIAGSAARWTDEKQFHITLQFLGYITSVDANELTERMQEVCAKEPQTFLEARNCGVFPSLGRPRVLWIGVGGDLKRLEHLQQRCIEISEQIGVVPEKRSFHPHITLARFKEVNSRLLRNVRKAVESCSEIKLGKWSVKEVRLMQSKLSSKGAEYSTLANFPLLGEER